MALVLEKIIMFDDDYWMRQAITLAKEAARNGEVPVGAIVVLDNKVIGEGFNQPISSCDPTAHAEIIALRDAAKKTNNYRLIDACLYVTLEPCTMCAGAMIHSRIKRLIYGASEPKAGVVNAQVNLLEAPYLNHKIEIVAGICSEECSAIMSAFFSKRRQQIKKVGNKVGIKEKQ
jgi:tRNA(adenine34) deaminase